MRPHPPPTASLNNKNSELATTIASSQNPRGNSKQSLLVLGIKQRQVELSTMLTASRFATAENSANKNQQKTLSFGWTEQLSSVYGSSCEAVFEVLSSIDASVRDTFTCATDHYASVCSALEIRHSSSRPANRQIYECCVAHDQLEELVLSWATAQAEENNVEKFTRLVSADSSSREENNIDNENTTTFDRLSWECESAAQKSISHHDTNTLHHSDAVDRNNSRRLQEQVRASRRALLELALKSADENNKVSSSSSSSLNLVSLEKEILRVWNSLALSSLNLGQSALGERGFVALLATLQVLPHLSSISITDSHLISPFIIALGVMCRPKYLPRLRVLDLNGNPGGSMAVEALCELVRAHPLLTDVRIDRGFECLPSSRKRLTNALNQNKTRNEIRIKKCQDELDKETRELREANERRDQDRLTTLKQNLLVVEDIELRARGMLQQIEEAEWQSEFQTGFEREKLSLEMFLQQQRDKEQQQIALAKKEQIWRETLTSERSSVEAKETGTRRGIESEAEKTLLDLHRREESKRESIADNTSARKQIGIDLEKDQHQRAALVQKLESARSAYKSAVDERLEVDRQIVAAKRQHVEKSMIETVNSDEPAARLAIDKTEESSREFLISGFHRESLDRQRRHEERLEIERIAAEQLTRRRMAQFQEDSIRQKEEEDERIAIMLRAQQQQQQQEEEQQQPEQQQQEEAEQEPEAEQAHENQEPEQQQPPQQPEQQQQSENQGALMSQEAVVGEVILEEELGRIGTHDEEAQGRGGIRLVMKMSSPSNAANWQVDAQGSRSSSAAPSETGNLEEEQEQQEQGASLPPPAENTLAPPQQEQQDEEQASEEQASEEQAAEETTEPENAEQQKAEQQEAEQEAAASEQEEQEKNARDREDQEKAEQERVAQEQIARERLVRESQLVADEEGLARDEVSTSEAQESGKLRLLMKMMNPNSKTNENWEKQKKANQEDDETSDKDVPDKEPTAAQQQQEQQQQQQQHSDQDDSELSTPKQPALTEENNQPNELSTPDQVADQPSATSPQQQQQNDKNDDASEISTPEKSPAPAKIIINQLSDAENHPPHTTSMPEKQEEEVKKEKSKSKSKSSSSGASRKQNGEEFEKSSSLDSDAIRQASTASSDTSQDSEL